MNQTINWQAAVNQCHDRGVGFVLITVVGATGSTPREGGSKIVVTEDQTFDTIGGGQLEFLAIQKSRELLIDGVSLQKLEHFPLASKAEQCCGGSMTLMFEVFPAAGLQLAIFGAGHVAKAVIKILAECDARIDWVDARQEQFPSELPCNVIAHSALDPLQFAGQLKANTKALILTHDHALDYRILATLLDETDIDYIGLIGSETKAKRFMKRLQHDGFSADDQSRCRCPVGIPAVKGKRPMEVAVSIAAEVLSLAIDPAQADRRGVSWREIKAALKDMKSDSSTDTKPVK
ncbi:MAG: xanthine dehydrogenase accessory factor [Candidatus Azotimanducaceae bacterium]